MDDEESWLYGDSSQTGEQSKASGDDGAGSQEQPEIVDADESSEPFQENAAGDDEGGEGEEEEGQANNEQENEEMNEGGDESGEDEDDDDDDDSDDDGFKITIDKNKIEEAKTSYQAFGLNKPAVRATPAEKKGKFTVEEFDQIGSVNGQVSVEYDLESVEDKPWRQPGSDISDYFNYGFTEETWNAYCLRQRRMRTCESGAGLPMNTQVPGTLMATSKIMSTTSIPSSGGTIPTLGVPAANGATPNRIVSRIIPETGGPLSGPPPPLHQPPPAIDAPTTISVMTSDKRNYSKKVVENIDFSVPPPGIPGLIPPGPPPAFDNPPPTFDAPPPTLIPPPGLPPPPIGDFVVGDDPFGYNYEGYEPTQESQWSLPPPAAADVPPGDPTYDDRDRDAWGRGRTSRDKSPTPRSYDRRADYAERERRTRERRRTRSRSPRERSRERERYDRSYRDRDREKRERDRRRSRSRSPRSPSGSTDRHKHKKSKKEKREDRRDKVDVKKEKDDD